MGNPSRFAAQTTVPVSKSKLELDMLLERHGAGSRGIMTDEDTSTVIVAFVIRGARFRMTVPLPKRREPERRWEQDCRTRWRAVLLLVKAKLESVAMGLSTVEREFMADMILPTGRTVEDELRAALSGEPGTKLLR